MFTGIIEKTATVADVNETNAIRRLTIARPWPDLTLGQSIAVNGCCLTVAALDGDIIQFDIVAETLAKTNLGRLAVGDEVHLERSLRVGDRLDGHFVQGHVDGVAPLLARQADDKECRLTVSTPPSLAACIVPKGSITIDGVSLTIAAVRDGAFDVVLIPTTLAVTALGRRPIGYLLNLEADILAKTIVFWLECRGNVGQSGGKR